MRGGIREETVNSYIGRACVHPVIEQLVIECTGRQVGLSVLRPQLLWSFVREGGQ